MSAPPKTPAAPLDPEVEAAIARAEARRGVLERVTQLGLALLEEVAQAQAAPEAPSEARAGAARGFAQVSRAVRMTIALEERIDARILALRNGDLSSTAGSGREGRRGAAKAAARAAKAEDNSQCPVRDPIQVAVWRALDESVTDPDECLHRYDRLYERLFETEAYDQMDLEDFEGAVKAICADLGVEPDWSGWLKGGDFTVPKTWLPATHRGRWTWDPAAAEARRAKLLADPARPKGVRALAEAGAFQQLE